MSTETDPTTPSPPQPSAKKVDFVTAPAAAMLVACVLAALGNSRGSALLTWQLPLGLMALAFVYVGATALRARR